MDPHVAFERARSAAQATERVAGSSANSAEAAARAAAQRALSDLEHAAVAATSAVANATASVERSSNALRGVTSHAPSRDELGKMRSHLVDHIVCACSYASDASRCASALMVSADAAAASTADLSSAAQEPSHPHGAALRLAAAATAAAAAAKAYAAAAAAAATACDAASDAVMWCEGIEEWLMGEDPVQSVRTADCSASAASTVLATVQSSTHSTTAAAHALGAEAHAQTATHHAASAITSTRWGEWAASRTGRESA